MNRSLPLLLVITLSFAISDLGAKTIKGAGTGGTKTKDVQVVRQKLIVSPVYKDASKLFQARNYAEALKKYQVLDSTGYRCDLLEYYIAQCYQKTNQMIPARQHYAWVSENTSDPQLRQYADSASQTIAHYEAHRAVAGQGNVFIRGGRRH